MSLTLLKQNWWKILLLVNLFPLIWQINKFVHPLDEGLLTSTALQVLHGSVMYKDFFEFWPPLSVYALAAAYGIFGAYFWVGRLLFIILAYSSSLLLYLCCRQAGMSRTVSTISAIVFTAVSASLVGYNHHWYGIVGLLLTLALTQKLLQTSRTLWLYAACIAIGLTATAMQFEAAAALGGLLVTLAVFGKDYLLRWKVLIGAAVLLLLPLSLWVAFFVYAGATSQMVYDVLIFPINQYQSVNGSVPRPLAIIQFVLCLYFCWALRKSSSSSLSTMAIFAVILQLLGLTSGNTDRNYLESYLVTTLLIYTVSTKLIPNSSPMEQINHLTGILQSRRIFIKRFMFITVMAGYAIAIALPAYSRWEGIWRANQRVSTAAGVVYARPEVANKLSLAISYISARSVGQNDVYFGPYASYYYLLTDKLDLSGFSQLTPNYNPDWMFEAALQNLERHKPTYIVLLPQESPFEFTTQNKLAQYIGHHYSRVQDLPRIQLFSSDMVFAQRIAELKYNQPSDGIYIRKAEE